MQRQNNRGFFNGVLLGMTLSFMAGLVAVYLLTFLGVISVSVLEVPRVQLVFEWSRRNLGLSVLPFAITLGLYIRSLRMLQHWLDDNRSPDEIGQLEHLNDVWTSLFFGIGVIWTAIGMRSALLFALGDPDVAAQAGAYAVLQRLVDGGILTALTTTIVGGVGGYMMRVTKSSLLGTRLSRYYEEHEQHHANRVEALLGEIRESLDGGGARTRTTYALQEGR
jgi:ABC-type nickel/cobalt efflux system permease component RcnA